MHAALLFFVLRFNIPVNNLSERRINGLAVGS